MTAHHSGEFPLDKYSALQAPLKSYPQYRKIQSLVPDLSRKNKILRQAIQFQYQMVLPEN